MKSVYKKLVNFQDAVDSALSAIVVNLESETIDLKESTGRILSSSIYAPRNNPPFNRSTMDGYAVRSEDIEDASSETPVSLNVVEESYIGESVKELSADRSCFKISTGAIVPVGSDSVVKVESTDEINGVVQISESVIPSENIAESGSDTISSELLLTAGREIETNDIAVLASLGIHEIPVYRKLRVNVISTGNELISYRENQFGGQINDANGIALTAELNSIGCVEATYSGIVKDDYGSIVDKMNDSLENNDLIILSGGSSAGEADLVYRIIEEYTPGIIFHGVLVKPGLPTVLGRKGGKAVIGLPGFPVSALMIFRSIFYIPILRAAGSSRIPDTVKGRLGINLKIDMGKQNLVPVSISERGTNNIYPVTGLSGSISRFTSTSGFISIPGNTKFLEKGKEVAVTLWGSRISKKNTILSGMFLKASSNVVRANVDGVEFHRMSPRDAVLSVMNGDSDISVFYAESGTDIRRYAKESGSSVKMEFYKGPEIELVIASSTTYTNFEEVIGASRPGDLYCGPSLRFLRNLVGESSVLRDLTSFIEKHLPNYFSMDLFSVEKVSLDREYAFSITVPEIAGKSGLKSLPLLRFAPVFVVSEGGKGKFNELVYSEKVTAL